MPTEEELQRQEENRGPGIVELGALIGAGAMGYRYRKQIGSGIRQVGGYAGSLSAGAAVQIAKNRGLRTGIEDIKTYGKALDEALDGRGAFYHMKNGGRFNDRFENSVQQSLEIRARSTGKTADYSTAKAFQTFDEAKSARNRAVRETFEVHRAEAVRARLEKALPGEIDKGLGAALDRNSFMDKDGSRWMDKVTPGKVSEFVDRLLDPNSNLAYKPKLDGEEARKSFEESIFKSVSDYSTRKSVGWQKDVNGNNPIAEALDIATKKNKDAIGESYKAINSPEDTWFARQMSKKGYRRQTIGDLLDSDGNMIDEALKHSTRATKTKGLKKGDFGKQVQRAARIDPEIKKLEVDPGIWTNKAGDVLDVRWMGQTTREGAQLFQDSVQVPFMQFNPMDLMHFTTWKGIADNPSFTTKKMGTIDPLVHGSVKEFKHALAHNQDAAAGPLARNYMNTPDGKYIDMFTGEVVKDNVYQSSARYGMTPRSVAGMANLHSQDFRNQGPIAKLFAYGKQETSSVYERTKTMLTKFDDPEWGPNIINSMKRWDEEALSGIPEDKRVGLSPESGARLINSRLSERAEPLSDDTVQYINKHVKNAFGDIDVDLSKLNTEEEIMGTLGRIYEATNDPSGDISRDPVLTKQIRKHWMGYTKDREHYLANRRMRPDSKIILPEFVSYMDIGQTDLVEKTEDVVQLIHQQAARQIKYKDSTMTLGGLVRGGIDEGRLEPNALKEVRHLETLTEMGRYIDEIHTEGPNKESVLREFSKRTLDSDDPLSGSLQTLMDDLHPKWAVGPGEQEANYFDGAGSVSINKAKGPQWMLENYNEQVKQGKSPINAAASSASTFFTQFYAGRNKLDNVTTASLPMYYVGERLDNALGQVGLGMSQKQRGSGQQVIMNQFGRRIALPYIAYQQAVWLDGMFGDIFSDTAAETYATMHADVGHVKEFLGVNDVFRSYSRVFQGSDQISENPLGRIFNFATLGAFTGQSGEEIEDFYESGEVAVRKGRYWGIGSNTPFTGGKIDRYVPNWYRRMQSDYKFTDTMYGDESEYWENHWMPTLTNPLAPIRHFITDPYHYEKKHVEDRPYAETGGFAELQRIPIIGSLLDNTVGRVLKPKQLHPELEKAHQAYLRELNEGIRSQYEQASQGGMLMGMPAGGYNLVQGSGGVTSGDIKAFTGGGVGQGGPGLASLQPSGNAEVAMTVAAMIEHQSGGATTANQAELEAINSIYSDIGGPSLGSAGQSVRSVTALEDLRDPEVLADLSDIGTMSSMGNSGREAFYSLSEIAGIYGFSTKTITGFEESGRGMTLEDSSRMASYQRAFWDMELGGLGGQISEIGRRYNPRDPNKNYWNPIRNTQEDWLPGSEYFVDFKHGDPYTKIANGEMRLPGAAYEKLHKLHPDAVGEYGVFDRFKILADVAPYSSNYKFYRTMVSKMNQAGMLDEDMKAEYAEIREQTRERKKKHRFYDRRFRDSDTQTDTVTITKMINPTTFMTKENPNNPIKLAGVTVKSSDEEAVNWLSQYLYEGAKVKIEVDDDPLFRVRDDMYNTMRAVVYTNTSQPGEGLLYSTKGQNLNFMLANRKVGGIMGLGGEKTARIVDDGSATATKALFSNDQITMGKVWESISHDILPSMPIVGTVADKFLQIRSPLEMYKKQEVYGKAWRPWEEPWKGWVEPMLDTIASRNPLVATLQGAGIGWLAAKNTDRGKYKFYGTRIGAMIGGGIATARVFSETLGSIGSDEENNTWLPERRTKEREINDYFDRLKYLKYRGLYEKTRRQAIAEEGIDVEEITKKHHFRGAENKELKQELNMRKKWLSLTQKMGYADDEQTTAELAKIRDELGLIDEDRPSEPLGELSMLALRYKEEYESTLFGADEHGDMTKIFRALPSKDREYFTEFMKASPRDREEILRLVPENQKRFYQAKWGLETDEPEDMRSFFKKYKLPDEIWDGWEADVSLDNYKIKVVKNESLELTEFNYWGDDEKRAESSDAELLDMDTSLSSRIDVSRLEAVLRGAGLKNVQVSMNTQYEQEDNKINLSMDVLKDRSKEIVNEINSNMGGIFG